MLRRFTAIVVGGVSAVYGYGAVMLVLLGQAVDATLPAAAGAAGSLALVALRTQHAASPRVPWAGREPLLLRGQVALAAGLAAWSAVGAAARHLAWPADVALAATELACFAAIAVGWPLAGPAVRWMRRQGRRQSGDAAAGHGGG